MANKIRVEVNSAQVAGRVQGKWRAGRYRLCAVIRDDCNRYVRFDKGTLRNSSLSASRLAEGLIIWNTPYARRVYYTGTPRTTVNPNASLQWCEKAKDAHQKKWRKMAAEIVGGE